MNVSPYLCSNFCQHPKPNDKYISKQNLSLILFWKFPRLLWLTCVFCTQQWSQAALDKISRLLSACKNPQCTGVFFLSEALLWCCSSQYRNTVFLSGSEHHPVWGLWDEWDHRPTLPVWALYLQAAQVILPFFIAIFLIWSVSFYLWKEYLLRSAKILQLILFSLSALPLCCDFGSQNNFQIRIWTHWLRSTPC